MAEFFIKRGDTSPSLQYTLSPTTDLTGATVVFNMSTANRSSVKVSRQTAVVVDAANGIVRYDWQSADTDTAGDFLGEFEVTYADTKVETFPNSDDIDISIGKDIA